MGVAFGHVLPDLLAVLQFQRGDAAPLPFHSEFQPDKEIPEFGGERGRRAYPVRFGKSPHFHAGYSVEAVNVSVIAAKVNSAVMKSRARPEILLPFGADREMPHHRSVASVETPENSAIATEVNALAVGGRKGLRNAMKEIGVRRLETP